MNETPAIASVMSKIKSSLDAEAQIQRHLILIEVFVTLIGHHIRGLHEVFMLVIVRLDMK